MAIAASLLPPGAEVFRAKRGQLPPLGTQNLTWPGIWHPIYPKYIDISRKKGSDNSRYINFCPPLINSWLRPWLPPFSLVSEKPSPYPASFRGTSFPARPKFGGLSGLAGSATRRSALCRLSDRRVAAANDGDGSEPQVQTRVWNWRGYSVRYQTSGSDGPALVLIHGFGANSDHWRKNIGVLARSHRVFAIDLIGYGYSDKPNPRQFGDTSFYTFETWANQLNDFCKDVVNDKAFFICNSIGGVVGLQAAIMEPNTCRGVFLLNISLRMLHIKKQPWFGRPFISSFQSLLRNTSLGQFFFKSVATPEAVKNILCQCYHDNSQVTEELVESILGPGLEPGAVDVFLEFICYSGGPLPEELLPQVKCPVLIAWGDKDPWEPVELGRSFGKFDAVEDFVVLPNVGHCPQDEAPDLVNPLVESFVARHSSARLSSNPVS